MSIPTTIRDLVVYLAACLEGQMFYYGVLSLSRSTEYPTRYGPLPSNRRFPKDPARGFIFSDHYANNIDVSCVGINMWELRYQPSDDVAQIKLVNGEFHGAYGRLHHPFEGSITNLLGRFRDIETGREENYQILIDAPLKNSESDTDSKEAK